jgi:hypothetical protein
MVDMPDCASDASTTETLALERTYRAVRRWLVTVVLAAWCVGALLFLRADGSLHWRIERSAAPPASEHNAAFYRFGPTLRASSYHREVPSPHHSIFLVDARAEPALLEKWTSDARDRAPWIEIGWREPRRLSRVVIYHAGWREHESLTVRRYRLSCLVEGDVRAASLDVTDNVAAIATHPLACERARGLRIDWTPNDASDQVRIYEVEAWAQ